MSLFRIGEENWWRLRRLKLSKAAESLLDSQGVRVISSKDPLEQKVFLDFVKARYEELEILPPHCAFPAYPWRFFAAYLPGQKGPASCAALVEERLPCAEVYPKELRRIKGWRRKVAEITLLATRADWEARNTIFHLFRAIYRYATRQKITDLVVCINPKHADFYEKILLFRRKGERKNHPFLPGLAVILEHLDLKQAPKEYFRVYQHFPPEFNLYQFFTGQEITNLSRPNRRFRIGL